VHLKTVSHIGTVCYCPNMGHNAEEQQIEAVAGDRLPFQASYAMGKSRDQIVLAVQRAAGLLAMAEFVDEMVYRQAVFALSSEGATVREIAALTGVPKSAVGRLLKGHKVVLASTQKDYSKAPPGGMANHAEALERLLDAWGAGVNGGASEEGVTT
jgi:hypothetical protein